MKNNIINEAEEIFLKITNVTLQQTIPSEPDIMKVQVEDKWFEIKSTEIIKYEVFRQKWFKTFHYLLPYITDAQWVILWNEVMKTKCEFEEAKEISDDVFIAQKFIDEIRDFPIKTIPEEAGFDIVNSTTFLEHNGHCCLDLEDIKRWLNKNHSKIQLSRFSQVLIELGVKEEGIETFSFFHKNWNKNVKLICWAFYPEMLKKWGTKC
jgi:hypothetical protein